MYNNEIEQSSIEDASKYAIEFCKKYPTWKRICDIENGAILHNISEVKCAFISEKGNFYKRITDIPQNHNSIMIVKI